MFMHRIFNLACENIRFSSLFAAGDVSRSAIFNQIVSVNGKHPRDSLYLTPEVPRVTNANFLSTKSIHHQEEML